jgi:nucleoside-diphosphate-sugar epimerase
MADIVRLLADKIGWNGRIVTVPDDAQPPGMNTAQHLAGDSSRIRRELGYQEVTPRDEAWERTITWELEGGPPVSPAEFDYEAEDELLNKYG